MKVLASDLTFTQRARLRAELEEGVLTTTNHAIDRAHEAGVWPFELEWALQYGRLIEFHNETGTRRILVRDHGICVVVDLDKRVIITVYRNAEDDHHSTLDRSVYQAGPIADGVLS